MKKFFLNILIFFLVTIPIYLLAVILSGTYVRSFSKNLIYFFERQSYDKFKEIDSYKNVDVLILGSSHAYKGYDVRLFQQKGLKTFNLGTSAQSPIESEFLFNKYGKVLNPKFVIIDIYPALLKSEGIESTSNLVSNMPFDRDVFKLVTNINDIKVYNTAIFSYFKQISSGTERVINTDLEKGSKYIPGGYVESYKTSKLPVSYKSSEYKVLPQQLEAIGRIIHSLNKKNIPFIVIQAPIYNIRYHSITNTNYIDKVLSGYGRYFNFNNLIKIPNSGYIDDSHLNQYGVNIFNNKLLELIKDKALIKNLKSAVYRTNTH